MYEVSRNVIHQGINYKVVDVLGNDLLLVVKESDFEKGEFPLNTFIVPDEEIIEKTKRMRQAKAQ